MKKNVKIKSIALNTKNKGNELYYQKTVAQILIQNRIKSKIKLSIIIPVYNAEKYLRKCLDSIINQKLKEIEIICVDDGSTDTSLNILQEYAKKDNRISVLTQTNLHAGVARNAGLSIASGEYIYFFDADDLLLPDGLYNIYQIVQSSCNTIDMVKFLPKIWDEKEKKEKIIPYYTFQKFPVECFNCDLTFKELPILTKLINTPWSGIYRREFLRDKNIYFDNLKCSNDVSFFIQCLINAKKIRLADIFVCVHRMSVANSLIDIRRKNFKDMIDSYYIIKELIKKEQKEFQKLILSGRVIEMYWRFKSYESYSNDCIKIYNILHQFVSTEDINFEALNCNLKEFYMNILNYSTYNQYQSHQKK